MRPFVFLGLFFSTGICAQQNPGVKLLAKVKDGSILLRWAPTNSLTWRLGNKNGYNIERFAITSENKITKPYKTLLTPVPLKPKPLPQWKNDSEINDYSAIAAQAIYGGSFQVALSENLSMTEVVNRSNELEQRFSFALFAADHSFATASLSALGFKDSTVRKGERYLYKVYVVNRDLNVKPDSGVFYLGLRDTVGLTPPMNLTAHFADRAVLLRWPKSFVHHVYTSFIIERSQEGGEFIKRNSAPYINSGPETGPEIFFQAFDSIPMNGIEYQYRVRGITPFGEVGPESERVSGKGYLTLDARASIIDAKEENGGVIIKWKTIGNTKSILGHHVERSDNGESFVRLNENVLTHETTSYKDLSPRATNYYRVKTLGENEQSSESFPVLVQLPDSTPPAPPEGLKAKIDTTGIVKLSWTTNSERDLLGYKVYRSNFLNSEFSLISPSIISLNSFFDTLDLQTLNRRVFYKLAAFDKRMNRSAYAMPVAVELPNITPPHPPSIIEIRPEGDGIFLRWNPSVSQDVVFYYLERTVKDSAQWQTIKNFAATDSLYYNDLSVAAKISYQYRIIAVDRDQHRSAPSNTGFGERLLQDQQRWSRKRISAKVDLENKSVVLSWKQTIGVNKYVIYRSEENQPFTWYRTIPGTSTNFFDSNLKLNTMYSYVIKIFFEGGYESRFSETVDIKF